MKFTYILLAFSLVGTHCEVTESEKEFEEEFGQMSDTKSKEVEAEALKESEDEINEANAKHANGDLPYAEKLNEFSNMPLEEFEKEKEGVIDPTSARPFVGDRVNGVFEPSEAIKNDPINRAKLERAYAELDRQATPDSYDARQSGISTEAKNQKSCGSCAAFGATALHEVCMMKAGAKNVDLSEQYLIDCGYNGDSMNGCNGAYPHAYTEFFAKEGGKSPHEASYLYLDRNPKLKCPSDVKFWNSGAEVTNHFYDYDCNAEKMKQLVVNYGAVMTAAYASDKGFANYAKGVFTGCTKTTFNHALLVTGFGTDPTTGKDYWIIKNSWGTTWGDQGYAKIERGINACGMEKVCVVAECTDKGNAETAPTTPKPAPIPAALYCDISELYQDKTITGTYTLSTWTATGLIRSKVRCTNSKCTPLNPGPSNACMYICGETKC